jgi:CheY-like chemotaxis protein
VHILVVEDEDAIRLALVRGLARGGDTVAGAASLAEGRALAAARRPDALVSDLKLPDGAGLDLARELAVPFILMTGYGTFDDAVTALRLGAVDFFTKPVSIRELRRSLEQAGGAGLGAPLLVDVGRERSLAVRGDRAEVEPWSGHAADWADPEAARLAYVFLLPVAPALAHRRILAELLQLVPAGRVVINRHGQRWTAWLDTGDLLPDHRDLQDARRLLTGLARRICWLADGGVVVECSHA